MRMRQKRHWGGVVLGVLCGCSSSRAPDELEGHIAQTVSAEAGAQLPGYVHSLSRSRFRIGNNAVLELNSTKLQRWRGTLGAFGVDPSTGLAMGVLDASSPTGPYITDEPTHRAAVQSYFVGAGLPANQMGDILADYQNSGSLPSSPASSPPQFDSINSVLTRVVNGIRIVESFAWAKMTTAGDVDMEAVFWPPVDMTVVNAATSLASSMQNAAYHTTFLTNLPGTVYKDGGVVIHHTNSAIQSAPTAYVAYDVVLDASTTATMRHFNANGAEFRLPQEMLSLATAQTSKH